MKKLSYDATYRNSEVNIYTENDRVVFEVEGYYAEDTQATALTADRTDITVDRTDITVDNTTL